MYVSNVNSMRGSSDDRTYWTHDGSLPLEHVVASGAGAARCGRIAPQVDEFLYRGASVRSALRSMQGDQGGATGPSRYQMRSTNLVNALQSHRSVVLAKEQKDTGVQTL
jgi:hypothetical protein